MASRTSRQISASAKFAKYLHVDRDAVVLHSRRHGREFAVMQGDVDIVYLGQHSLEKTLQIVDVASAIVQNTLLLLRRERPAAHDAISHRVFAFLVGVAEPEIAQGAEQALAL